jgi:hypothetical protein
MIKQNLFAHKEFRLAGQPADSTVFAQGRPCVIYAPWGISSFSRDPEGSAAA